MMDYNKNGIDDYIEYKMVTGGEKHSTGSNDDWWIWLIAGVLSLIPGVNIIVWIVLLALAF